MPRFTALVWLIAGFALMRLSGADAPRVATLDFTTAGSGTVDVAALGFSRTVQARLQTPGDYVWIERQELDRIVAEANLAAFGGANARDALRLGHWLHADLLVRGEVTPLDAHTGELRVEVIELARADVLATQKVPITLTPAHRLQPSAREIDATTAAVLTAIAEAQHTRVRGEKQTVVAPLYFKNVGLSDRLNFLEDRLYRELAAAGAKGGDCRILQFPRPADSSAETELGLSGLTDLEPKAWQRVANVYLWGTFEEVSGEGLTFEEVPVKISLQIWGGGAKPRDISWQGKVSEIATGLQTVTADVLREATALAQTGSLADGERVRVAASLVDRAREMQRKLAQLNWLPPTMAQSDFARSVAGKQLFAYRLRLLDTACFFDPLNRIFQDERLRSTWFMPNPLAPLASRRGQWKRVSDYQMQARRFGVGRDGVPDRAVLTAAADALTEYAALLEGGTLPEKLSPEETHAQLVAARRAWGREVMGVNQLAAQAAVPPAWLPEVNVAWAKKMGSSDSVLDREQYLLLWPSLKKGIGTILRAGGAIAVREGDDERIIQAVLSTFKSFGEYDLGFRLLDEAWDSVPFPSTPRPRSDWQASPPRNDPWGPRSPQPRPLSSLVATAGKAPPEELPHLDAFVRTIEPWPLVYYTPSLEKKLTREITALAWHDGALWIAEHTDPALPPSVGANPQGNHYLWRYDPGSHHTQLVTPQLTKHSIIRSLVSQGGDLWLGLDADGVWRWPAAKGEPRRFTGEDGLVTSRIVAGTGSPSGMFFMGGTPPNFVVGQFDATTGKWRGLATPPMNPASMQLFMGPDQANAPAPALAFHGEWLGVCTPVTSYYHLGRQQWVNLQAIAAGAPASRPGIPAPVMGSSSLSADESGFWLSGPNSLIFMNPDNPTALRVFDNLPGSPVATVHQGDWLWLTTEDFSRVSSLVLFNKKLGKVAGSVALPGRGMNKLVAQGTHAWVGGKELVEVVVRGVAGLEDKPVAPASADTASIAGGWTSLHAAAETGDQSGAARLLAAGAKPNAVSAAGDFPLLLAIQRGDRALAQLLLDKGADPNFQGEPAPERPQTEVGTLNRWEKISHLDASTPPAQPTQVQATMGVDGRIRVSWDDRADNESVYVVHRLQLINPDIGYSAVLFYVPANTTSWIDSLPRPTDEQLIYHVVAVNGAAPDRAFDAEHAASAQIAAPKQDGAANKIDEINTIHQAAMDGRPIPSLNQRRTALHAAAATGDVESARLLLDHGANPNLTDATGATPLLLAARNGSAAMVRLLLEHKAQADRADSRDLTPAYEIFVRHEDEALFRELLASMTPEARWRSATALLQRTGRIKDIELLVSLGAELEACDSVGNSILSNAIDRKLPSVVTWLRERKYDLNHRVWAHGRVSTVGEQALLVAIDRGELDAATQLLDSGIDANATPDGNSLLAIAAERNDAAAVEMLLKHGANRTAVQWNGNGKPLSAATTDPKVRALLEGKPAHWNPPDRWIGYDPGPRALEKLPGTTISDASKRLLAAAPANDLAAATHALADGAALDDVDPNGKSALMLAVKARSAALTTWLLDAGAPVHQVDPQGWAALGYAIQAKDPAAVRALLLAGANPNFSRKSAMRPLNYAVVTEQLDTVLLLLDAGANPNLFDADVRGGCPLAAALEAGNKELVDLLLSRGANPRAQDYNLFSASTQGPSRKALPSLLMYAASNGNVDLVKKMISLGQDPRVKIDEDYDALAWAANRGNLAAVEVLIPLTGPSPHAMEAALKSGNPAIIGVLAKAGYR